MSVCVVGSVALDDVKTPHGDRKNILGGSAMHFANSACILTGVRIVGVVGGDYPKTAFDLMKSKNIDTKGIEVIEQGKTFHWQGYYEKDMNVAHTISTELGVFENFNPKIPDEYKDSKIVFLANIDPVIQLKVKKETGDIFTMLDTMNLWIDIKKSDLENVIKEVDILLVNEGEARQLTEEDNLLIAADKLLELGPKYIIIKKGHYGVAITGKDFYFSLPAYPVKNVVDPTGAGDSFAGGFVSYLASASEINQETIKMGLAYGTIIASFYVQGFGIEGFENVKAEDIKKRLADYHKMITLPEIS